MEIKPLAKTFAQYLVVIAGALLVLVSFASLAYNTGYWYLQVLNFPRLQTLLLLLLFIGLFVWLFRVRSLLQWLFVAAMGASTLIQSYILFPYLPIAKKSIASINEDETNQSDVFSLLLANVYMHNKQTKKLLALVDRYEPSIIIVMEVNDWWADQLNGLKKKYPYAIEYPADNTYGMIVYSKLPLQNTGIRFLSHDSVPSFYATVRLANNKSFQLVAIHPVAPKPSSHPDNVNENEVALVKAGKIAKTYTIPAIVAGDFNDVGWSHNSNQFEKLSGLRDVRNGRGLYNTFSTKSFILRWPLDYVYASNHFRVIELKRLDAFGSDHFPYYVKLALP